MHAERATGDRIGRYLIEASIGRGGMGVVYRAYDEVLRRRVALKLLTSAPDDEESLARFLREARMAAAFEHPNVVAFHDFGADDGVPFLVMEFVAGRTLRQLLEAGVGSFDERRRWLVGVANALAAAHRAGLVHRDIKPENVMLRDDGLVKVLDFGIARRGDDALAETFDAPPPFAMVDGFATFATREGHVTGTPGYIAPELVLRGEFDGRSDQFAWGVMAHELFAGRLPWNDVAPLAILNSIVAERPLAVDASALPPTISGVVTRALELDPARRYPTMDALLSELEPAPAAERPAQKISIVPAPLEEQATLQDLRPARVRPSSRTSLLFAAGALLALAAGGAVAYRFFGGRAHDLRLTLAATRRLTTDNGCQEFASFTPDGKSIVFDTSGDMASHLVVMDLATHRERALTEGPSSDYAASLSPDGREVAFLRDDGAHSGTFVVPLDGSAPPRKFAEWGMQPGYSPNGDAIWAEAGVRIDRRTSARTRSLEPPERGCRIVSVVELADGRVAARVAWCLAAAGVYLYPVGQGRPVRLLEGQAAEFLVLAPGGAGLLAATKSTSGNVTVSHLPLDGSRPRAVGIDLAGAQGFALSRSADRAVWSTCSAGSQFVALDASSPAPRPLGGRSAWRDMVMASIPGTRELIAVSDRGGQGYQLWRMNLDGTHARRLETPGLTAFGPAVSRDGRFVAFRAVGAGIFAMPSDGSEPPRRLTTGPDGEPAFSRDGQTVFFTRHPDGDEPHVERVPFGGGETAAVLAAPSHAAEASPSEDALYYFAGPKLMRMDLASGKAEALGVDLENANDVRVSPDGTRLLIANGATAIEIEAATRRELARHPFGADGLIGIAYGPDGPIGTARVWSGHLLMADVTVE